MPIRVPDPPKRAIELNPRNGRRTVHADSDTYATRKETMTTTWALNTFGLFVTTVGVLLTFLYLWKSPRFADQWLSPEGKKAYARHRRLLIVVVALLAAWLIVQYLAVIFL
jgi:hypothetical protein